jgi:purine-nucleoside phosphorylase
MTEQTDNPVDFLRSSGVSSLTGVISTGSGQPLEIPGIREINRFHYNEIPGFVNTTLLGHGGMLRIVEGSDGTWALWIGRKHFYQGFDYGEITSYLDISRKLGADKILCLNASGGLTHDLNPGDLVIVEKFRTFISWDGNYVSPDGSPVRETSVDLMERLNRAGERSDNELKKGIYAGVPGPVYETHAEVNWLRKLGCSLVGMSTVPELLRGMELEMESIAVALVANVHTHHEELTHEKVVRNSRKGAEELNRLISAFLAL